MKTTIKVFLAAALLCGTVMADDGDMGNGGLWANSDTKVVIVVNDDGDMGNGGKTCQQGQTGCIAASADNQFSVLDFVRGFLTSIL